MQSFTGYAKFIEASGLNNIDQYKNFEVPAILRLVAPLNEKINVNTTFWISDVIKLLPRAAIMEPFNMIEKIRKIFNENIKGVSESTVSNWQYFEIANFWLYKFAVL